MYGLYKTVRDRLKRYLMASESLTADSLIGTNTVTVADSDSFEFQGLTDDYPTVILMDNETTGQRIEEGYAGAELINVSSVDGPTITFDSNLTDDWLLSKSSTITRAAGGVPVRQVVIGDLEVINVFPTVCVVPMNKTRDWYILSGTWEVMSIDFMIYVEHGGTELATIDLLKVTDVVEWILMSNLHLAPQGSSDLTNITSRAIVSNVDYGVVQKGSAFLKAAKVTWTGEVCITREYLHGQKPYYEG